MQCTQHLTQDTHIFTCNLNSIYLIHNHIWHPSSQHNDPYKLLIATIVNHITWTTHKITIQKVRAHTGITCNDIANQLANSGALLNKPDNTPMIHTTHTTPYWLNGVPTCSHTGAIRNLQNISLRNTQNQELRLAQSIFTYIEKWTSNDQINHKLSNQFWKKSRDQIRSNYTNPKLPLCPIHG